MKWVNQLEWRYKIYKKRHIKRLEFYYHSALLAR